VIVTVSVVVGLNGECITETVSDCVSMLKSAMEDPIEHAFASAWPDISILVGPFACVSKTVNE